MDKAAIFSTLGAKQVSVSVAIALALGMATAANAQYTYPGSASSSGYATHGGYTAHHGAASVPPSIGQSRSNVGSRAPTKTTGKSGYQYGQTGPTTITGVNGQKVTVGGTQTIQGVNGKKVTVGGNPSMKGLHGQSYSAGVTTGPQRNAGGVNAQGDHQGGVYLNNGGSAGASKGKKTVQNFDEVTQRNKDGTYSPKPGKDPASKDAADGTKSFGCSVFGFNCGSKSATTKVSDPRTVDLKHKEGGGVGDDPDIGSQGGGTLVSGTGKGINPGHRPGQDGGDGPGKDGAPTGGGSNRNNATGAYVVTSKNGQDIPAKPKPTGPMTNSYNGVKGVTDPKRGGHAGGG